MVGVPHSTGCARCRERRIKCDESTPHCTQCRKYGRPCPGYQRTYRFQDEGPGLERRHQSSRRPPPGAGPASPHHTVSPPSSDAAAVVRTKALAMIQHSRCSNNDNSEQQPRIPAALWDRQPQLFGEFLRAVVPTMYTANRARSNTTLDCAGYIAHTFGRNAFHDGAVVCLTSIYRAQATRDRELLKTARQVYAYTLQQVVGALQVPELAMSADMLSAIMMLAVYEMAAQTSADAWVVHADGVKRLMVSRGADAHSTGFARSCYLAFRGVLVAAAVHEGTPCFLDADDWQALARRLRDEDMRAAGSDDWAAFVGVAELVGLEIVKCPRYLAEARSVQSDGALRALVHRVRASRQRLHRLQAELRACCQMYPRLLGGGGTATGPGLLVQGAESAESLLDGLLDRLRDDEVLPFRVVSPLTGAMATELDRVASSMGMLGTALVMRR